MSDIRPDLTAVRAVAVTTCPLLAAHLAGQQPAVSTALLTRLAGIGTLRDVDALLLLTRHDPDDRAKGPAGNGLVTETLYIGTNLDDADVWARAVKLRAAEVLFAPGDGARIAQRLVQHLGVRA